MSIMSWKTYLIIALGMGLLIFLVGTFFGHQIAGWSEALAQAAQDPWNRLAGLLLAPVEFAMLNPILGAIIFGLLWPLAAVLILTMLVIVLLVAASGATVRINTQK